MENMETENWINNVLNSTNGMMEVAPSADLYFKIEQKIFLKKNTYSSKTVWLIAASIIVLVTINVCALHFKNKTNNDTSETIIASTLIKSNQLY